MTLQTTRRNFLRGAGAAGAVLIVGFDARGALAAGPEGAALNPFVTIGADGTVTVVLKHFEMGQGTSTGLTTLVAEEMDADWDRVAIAFAPANEALYKNLLFGSQGTGGSTAIANSYLQYRQAGAAARAVLVRAAADAWGVAPEAVTVENGILRAGDRSAHFGEVAAAAAALEAPAEPTLKTPDQFRLIGAEKLPRKDSAAKTDGTAEFAIDVMLPGMVTAVMLRAPKFGGRLVAFDAAAAAEVPGFVDAKAAPNGKGVLIFGRNTWAAIKAREAVTAEWDFAEAETRSTDAMAAEHVALLDAEAQFPAGGDAAATEAAMAGAAQTVEADFVLPFLAHAPMEPLNCVIEPTEGGVRVHDGCQFPSITKPTVAAILGLNPEQVEIRTVYAGGSFGRRANLDSDYHAEAAMAFAALGGKTAVKLMWTREDDLAGGYFRPMAAHRVRIGLTADGKVAGWRHRIAAKPIFKGTAMESFVVKDGVDHASVEGIADTPYAVPAMSVGLSDFATPVPVLWWRAVGHTHTAFAMEVAMDLAAEAAGADPVSFRLGLLPQDTADGRRMAGVLRLAAEKAGWDAPAPEGRFRGVAAHKSFNSYVAQVVEISLRDGGAVKVERVVCAVDCGVAVNPDVIRAQMEGGIGYGLSAAMRNAITMTEGQVDQLNFPDYDPLRIAEMPAVETHIVVSTEAPTGVGEPGLPPLAPALANAIRAATGKRVARLPMVADGVTFA
jgi:isoquinoline 1-oxidoreductase beta subunit